MSLDLCPNFPLLNRGLGEIIALDSNFYLGFKYRQTSGLESYFEDMSRGGIPLLVNFIIFGYINWELFFCVWGMYGRFLLTNPKHV